MESSSATSMPKKKAFLQGGVHIVHGLSQWWGQKHVSSSTSATSHDLSRLFSFFFFFSPKSSINKVPRLFWWREKVAVCQIESALKKSLLTLNGVLDKPDEIV